MSKKLHEVVFLISEEPTADEIALVHEKLTKIVKKRLAVTRLLSAAFITGRRPPLNFQPLAIMSLYPTVEVEVSGNPTTEKE